MQPKRVARERPSAAARRLVSSSWGTPKAAEAASKASRTASKALPAAP